jgi:hypothetical protein
MIGRLNRSANNVGRINVRRRAVEVEPHITIWATTTTTNQTVTLNRVYSFGGTCLLDWGDGQQSEIPDQYTGTVTHEYTAADTYEVKIFQPEILFHLWVQNNAWTVNSAEIAVAVNITNLRLFSLRGGHFDSADVIAWQSIVSLYLHSLPVGYTGTFDTGHISHWRLTVLYLYNKPAGYTITISPGAFSEWDTASLVYMYNNGFNSTQVDQILADFWDAFPTKTRTDSRLRIQNNAVPGGIYQPANPPTTGMEYKYELLNDSQDINPTYKWIEVNTDT